MEGSVELAEAHPFMSLSGGVAVLFAGSWRYEERTVATVARHLVMPLQAVALAVFSGSGPGRLERWQMKRFFPGLAG